MNKFDIELVGKVGSMALVNKAWGDIDYNVIARISRELIPGTIWVTSGATEIGRLDYVKRNGREIDGKEEDNKIDYAAQGQAILMANYRQYIDPKYSVRQILVEH
ncbi:MAG: uridylate kinase, partial [Christensenellales bacterium]